MEENMKLIGTGARVVTFYLNMAFLSQYGLDFETFEKRKLLEEIRNYDNMTYIRKNFIICD